MKKSHLLLLLFLLAACTSPTNGTVQTAIVTETLASPENRPQPTPTTPSVSATAVPEPAATPTAEPSPEANETLASAADVVGETAVVIRVIDGDTIEVQIEGIAHRVRYIGMDTPERGDPFFGEATTANRQLVGGQTVTLVKDVSERDRFGRLLRYVYLEDGTFVNAELVRLGYAQVATFPPDVRHQGLFVELQQEARAANVGLWPQTVVQVSPTHTATPQPQPTHTLPATAVPQPQPTNIPESPSTPAPTNPSAPSSTPAATPTAPPAAAADVQISFIFFDGVVAQVESDEYAEITNRGGSPVNLAGWRLNADDDGQDFWFPAFDLQPGQSCRVYTNEAHPESCGFSFNSGRALWANAGECGHLFDNDGREVSVYCY